ncbi:hypothetical protein T439DRAFT_294175 [Meredithblackwellia eburnea MCA 4105]
MTPLTPGTPNESSNSAGAFKFDEVVKSLRGTKAGTDEIVDGTVETCFAAGFEDWVVEEGEDAIREQMDRVVRGWKMAGLYSDALGGWRDEEYGVYAPHPPFDKEAEPRLPGDNFAFSLERSACALFGLATYGVHLTAYVEEPDEPLKIWVPKRAISKQTWGGYLDNTVAGGITSRATPLSSIIRECEEEASLPADLVEPLIRSTSLLSYTYRTETGWIQPEVQYIYDLKLGKDVTPKTNDDEVESFTLMEVEEVVDRMCKGEFKPNCSLVLIDFFIRHGFLTAETDARFLEVATRLRRPLVLPGPI